MDTRVQCVESFSQLDLFLRDLAPTRRVGRIPGVRRLGAALIGFGPTIVRLGHGYSNARLGHHDIGIILSLDYIL